MRKFSLQRRVSAMHVFDSSAILAYLLGETGSEKIREMLELDAVCSAINWAEIAQKSRARGLSWERSRALLLGFGLSIEPATREDGEAAALLWTGNSSLSLADRICLALGSRLGARIITCDRAWEGLPEVELVR
jgi:ribonuclease VapC